MNDFETLSQIHLIRPEALYLLLIIPCIIILKYLLINISKIKHNPHGWYTLCSKAVLDTLYINKIEKNTKTKYLSMLISWLLIILSLSGPSLSKQEVQTHQNSDSWIIALSLAESMESSDLTPSRLERAKYKIKDFLNLIDDQQLAFLVYSDTAFEIIPLTSDKKTIEHIIPTIEPLIMPSKGDNIDAALLTAKKLSDNLQLKNTNVLILTDSQANSESLITAKELSKNTISLNIIDFNKAHSSTPNNSLKELTSLSGGSYHVVSNNDTDIKSILSNSKKHYGALKDNNLDQLKITLWHDLGPWLLLFALPFIFYTLFIEKLFAFKTFNKKLNLARSGHTLIYSQIFLNVICLLLICIFTSSRVHAEPNNTNNSSPSWLKNTFDSLWFNKQQNAANKIKKNEDLSSIESNLFDSKQWQATAQYKKKQYSNAEQILKDIIDNDQNKQNQETVLYNYANSLAKQGKIPEAINSYKQVLDSNPNHENAKFNKELLENYQQSQEKNSKKQNNNQEKNQNEQDQNNNNNSSSANNNKDGQENSKTEPKNQDQQSKSQKQDTDKQQVDDSQNNNNNVNNQQLTAQQNREQKNQKELNKWLDSIPDNPASYLRNQLYYEYWLDKQKTLP